MKRKARILTAAIIISLLTTCTKARESNSLTPKAPPESHPGQTQPLDPFAPPPSGLGSTEFV